MNCITQILRKPLVMIIGGCVPLLIIGLLFQPYVAIGEMGLWSLVLPGMARNEAPGLLSDNSDNNYRKLTLPRPSGLGTYGATVAAQLEIFKQSAEDHFLGNITSATNLTEQQKTLIRRSVAKMGKKLSGAFTRVGKTSGRSLAVPVSATTKESLRAAFTVRAARGGRRIRGKFLPMPLNGKIPGSESKAIAVYQVNSYLGFLIHFLSNSNSSGSLINQLKDIATTEQAAYLEELRTRLNLVLASSIGSVTKQTKAMLARVYRKKSKRTRKLSFMDFLAEGDNTFAFASDSISAGTSRAPSLAFNLDTSTRTAMVTLENVRGGPIAFTTVYDPVAAPPTLTVSNGSASFVSAFATFASFIGGQFAFPLQMSSRSTIQDSRLLIETSYTIVAGQADITIDLSITKKGYISGTIDLNLPGLPEGFSMDVCLFGYVNNQGAFEMMQLGAFPTSLGTGGHQIQKYTRTT